MDLEDILIGVLYILLILMIAAFVFAISTIFWGDSKTVCKYWEEKDGKIECVQETTIWCPKKCD